MRQLTTIASTLIALAASTAASAGTFGGYVVSLGNIRPTNWISQNSTAGTIATNWVEVDYCSGVTEYLHFSITSATSVKAVGSAALLTGKILSANVTEYMLVMHTASDEIKAVRIMGSNNTRMAFDIKSAPGDTPRSLTGLNFTPVQMSGFWMLEAELTDAVALPPNPPIGDMYASLHLNFSDCFKPSDKLVFRIDTDTVR